MPPIKYISEVDDLSTVSTDLNYLLNRRDNRDIAKEFPNLVAGLSGDLNDAHGFLYTMRSQHEPGVHEVFIASTGRRAIGLSVISRQVTPPMDISTEAPNLSGFICIPYRGLGLGRMSLESRMRSVESHFGGIAWTSVHVDNQPSNHLIKSVGFELASRDEDRNIYIYSKK